MRNLDILDPVRQVVADGQLTNRHNQTRWLSAAAYSAHDQPTAVRGADLIENSRTGITGVIVEPRRRAHLGFDYVPVADAPVPWCSTVGCLAGWTAVYGGGPDSRFDFATNNIWFPGETNYRSVADFASQCLALDWVEQIAGDGHGLFPVLRSYLFAPDRSRRQILGCLDLMTRDPYANDVTILQRLRTLS